MSSKLKEKYMALKEYEENNKTYQIMIDNAFKVAKRNHRIDTLNVTLVCFSLIVAAVCMLLSVLMVTAFTESRLYQILIFVTLLSFGLLYFSLTMYVSEAISKKIDEIELTYINGVAKNNAKTKKDGLDIISLEDKMYVVENGSVVSKGFPLSENAMSYVPERKEYFQVMYDGEISLNVEYDISCLKK